ncbi:MAG: DegT/DnrJ/EryC1/StrS family aminotransferase, partial [Oscillospiraceae bacterium]
AMLALFCPPGSTVLMARASHTAAIHAAALLDLSPVWLWPDEPSGVGTPGLVSCDAVAQGLAAYPNASAVYLTSPDYFGSMSDISQLAAHCRAASVPLLVDNAHGAHLTLTGQHPMQLGADACCDSLHKTLPALTGAALLHLRNGARRDEARRCLNLFGSTSPSYLVMLSADRLAGTFTALRTPWQALQVEMDELRKAAVRKGIWATVGRCDATRVALLFPDGERSTAAGLLNMLAIEPEYLSARHIVLIPAPGMDLAPVRLLIERLPSLTQAPALPHVPTPERVMGLREAVLSPSLRIPLSEAVGRVCAAPLTPCPPGLPLVMPGERIWPGIDQIFTGMPGCFVIQ